MRPQPSCRPPSIPCSAPTRDKPGGRFAGNHYDDCPCPSTRGSDRRAAGLLGGGGSILAVPALVYALGLGVELAIPISLIVIGSRGDTAQARIGCRSAHDCGCTHSR